MKVWKTGKEPFIISPLWYNSCLHFSYLWIVTCKSVCVLCLFPPHILQKPFLFLKLLHNLLWLLLVKQLYNVSLSGCSKLLFWSALLGSFQCRLHHSECQYRALAQSPFLSSGRRPCSPEPRWGPWPSLGSLWFPTLLAVVTGPGLQIGTARPRHAFLRVSLTHSEAAGKMLGATWVESSKEGPQSLKWRQHEVRVGHITFGSSHLIVWAAPIFFQQIPPFTDLDGDGSLTVRNECRLIHPNGSSAPFLFIYLFFNSFVSEQRKMLKI